MKILLALPIVLIIVIGLIPLYLRRLNRKTNEMSAMLDRAKAGMPAGTSYDDARLSINNAFADLNNRSSDEPFFTESDFRAGDRLDRHFD